MIATNAPCGGGLYTGAPGLGGTNPPAGGALRGGGGAAEDAAGGPFGGVTGCCAPGAPAAAPLGAGRTRPTGGGGSMRSAAALGSVFSGSSTSPSSGAAKPMPISLPLSSKPKGDEERARRFGGEAGGAKGCGGTTDAERIRGGGWAGAIAADCHAALEAAAFGAGAAGPSSGAVASACAALACGALPGGALAMRRGAPEGTNAARGLSPLLITMRGGSTRLGSARARLGRRSGTESSGDASSTDGLPNLAALFSRAPSRCSAADLLGGDFGLPMS